MTSVKRQARIAGLWYLAMAVSGPIGIVYAPGKVLVPGDAAATMANLTAHAFVVRVGIVSSLFCQVSFVFLVMALRRLLHGVNAERTRLMVSLVIPAVPIAFVNELFQLAALELSSGAGYLNAIPAEQRSAFALFFATLHQQGIHVVEIFWGLWLLPFGLLVIRSRFIPPVLGALLLASCASYILESTVALLAPQYFNAVSGVVTVPMALGEVSMVLWLLIKGVRGGTPVGPLPAAHLVQSGDLDR